MPAMWPVPSGTRDLRNAPRSSRMATPPRWRHVPGRTAGSQVRARAEWRHRARGSIPCTRRGGVRLTASRRPCGPGNRRWQVELHETPSRRCPAVAAGVHPHSGAQEAWVGPVSRITQSADALPRQTCTALVTPSKGRRAASCRGRRRRRSARRHPCRTRPATLACPDHTAIRSWARPAGFSRSQARRPGRRPRAARP